MTSRGRSCQPVASTDLSPTATAAKVLDLFPGRAPGGEGWLQTCTLEPPFWRDFHGFSMENITHWVFHSCIFHSHRVLLRGVIFIGNTPMILEQNCPTLTAEVAQNGHFWGTLGIWFWIQPCLSPGYQINALVEATPVSCKTIIKHILQ